MEKYKILFLAVVLLTSSICLQAQKRKSELPLKIKIAYFDYKFESNDIIVMNAFSCDVAYNLNKTFQVGANLGYGFFDRALPYRGGISYDGKSSALLYGVFFNASLLAPLSSNKKLRFDLYGSFRLDCNYKFTDATKQVDSGNELNFGTYIGASYYFGKHWGLFFEYGFSNTYNMRYGLALKF